MNNEAFKAKLKTYRLTESEYHKICELLRREPKDIEWALFSALWSEHCSYKSSKVHLRKFAKTMNQTVTNASGENAGIIDIGFGEKIAFKMESHNHPSFIEPFQGAATGVGGILRDIFTMGARPIALANYLCFGEIQAPRMKELVDGVVRGISSYGNCVGVPTVTGQTQFFPEYNQNILVNAMAVGYLGEGDPVALSGAKGPGNYVVYVGAKTGKDGVHGAAMASESFGEDNEAKRPNIQIGDPYFEKLLIESCIEVIQKKLVIAIQDMGAAGLTSSSFEMASKGQVGMEMHLDRVPSRDLSIGPEELLLSESQERMLLVCEPSKYQEIQKHFAHWGLDAVEIGRVIAERKVKLYWKNELLTEINPDLLVEDAPVYQREFYGWKTKTKTDLKATMSTLTPQSLTADIGKYQTSAKNYIFEQFDQRVGAKTAASSDQFDIAMLRLPSARGLAIALGCRPQLMKIDAAIGAADAVIYPTLQMAVKGAKALAVTDCLNFASPERIEIMSEFVASVDAICEASICFETPVISGNVSFYNETQGKGIISTPATGLVGIRDSVEGLAKDQFQEVGNRVYLVQDKNLFYDSESFQIQGSLELKSLKAFQQLMLKADDKKIVKSSQMVSLGSLALQLAKMSLKDCGIEVGAENAQAVNLHSSLQPLYQAVIEVSDESAWQSLVAKFSTEKNLQVTELGQVITGELKIGSSLTVKNQDLAKSYAKGIS